MCVLCIFYGKRRSWRSRQILRMDKLYKEKKHQQQEWNAILELKYVERMGTLCASRYVTVDHLSQVIEQQFIAVYFFFLLYDWQTKLSFEFIALSRFIILYYIHIYIIQTLSIITAINRIIFHIEPLVAVGGSFVCSIGLWRARFAYNFCSRLCMDRDGGIIMISKIWIKLLNCSHWIDEYNEWGGTQFIRR